MFIERSLVFKKKNKNIFTRTRKLFTCLFLYSSCYVASAAIKEEYQSMDALKLKREATALSKAKEALEERLKAMEESLSSATGGGNAEKDEEILTLQSRVQELESKGAAVIDVAAINKQCLELIVGALDRNKFDSPIKKAREGKQPVTPGYANLRDRISSIIIDIDPRGQSALAVVQNTRSAVIEQVLAIFQEYISQPGADKENLSITVRNGNSPVKTIHADPRLILQSFERILYGVLDPNLAQLLKDCQLQVVLPDVHQPSPVLDLKKEGARYVGKIKTAIDHEGTLYDLVQRYRHEEHIEGGERHAMLLTMLGYNIETAATKFEPTKEATTMIEIGEELRDRFFDTAFLTFIHYMSGNTNKTKVSEIIALTNGGRGQNISESVLTSLHSGLHEIFYPRRQSGSFTVTRYEFAREAVGSAPFATRRVLANYPVANAVVTVASGALNVLDSLFGSCMAPPQNLLTNGDTQSSGLSSATGSQRITDGSEDL